METEILSEEDVKIGDNIIIGEYYSDARGCPKLKWTEVTIESLPLPYTVVYIKKHR